MTQSRRTKSLATDGARLLVLQEIDAQIDQLREQQQLALLLIDQRHAHLETERVRARQRIQEIVVGLELRTRERASMVRRLPIELVASYEAVRRRWLMRPWVVALSRASCAACSAAIPERLVEDLARGGAPCGCPGCSRILVWSAS